MKKIVWILFIFTFIALFTGCGSSKVEDKIDSKPTIPNADVSEELSKDLNVNSGLLVGLARDNEINRKLSTMERVQNSYRTIWIYPDKDKMNIVEKNGVIIVPYEDRFLKLENNNFFMATPSNQTGDRVFDKYSTYYNFTNIVSHDADKPVMNLFTEETFRNKYLSYEEAIGKNYKAGMEWLWYVGNSYASIMSTYYETGGGSYKSGWDSFKTYDIKDLAKLESRNKFTKLSDLLEEKERTKLREYPEKYNKVINSNTNVIVEEKIDIENIILTRKEGKWQVVLPLFTIYQHNGNGSRSINVKECIFADIKLPKVITSYDELCLDWNVIKKNIPLAKDAVSSPNNDMLAVLTTNQLLVFTNPKDGINIPSLTIDVDANESIILNQWATGAFASKWSKLINSY